MIDAYGDAKDITWVMQEEQKGTGHAVMVCREAIVGQAAADNVFVLGGDGPLIRAHSWSNWRPSTTRAGHP